MANLSTEFLTTRELAELLHIKERKVYDLAAEGARAAGRQGMAAGRQGMAAGRQGIAASRHRFRRALDRSAARLKLRLSASWRNSSRDRISII